MATVLQNLGEQYVCDFLSGVTSNLARFIGWGTGAGTALKGDTALDTEASETRATGTQSTDGTGTSAKFKVIGTITSTQTHTIVNAGLFETVTNGIMVMSGDFTGVALLSGDKIEFTFTLDPA